MHEYCKLEKELKYQRLFVEFPYVMSELQLSVSCKFVMSPSKHFPDADVLH